LLSNAIKFTNKGHVIFKVKLLEPTKFDTTLSNYFSLIQFEIEDSGIGINQNKLESIFLPFEQVGDKKINSQGTGLGLAISQKIAEMMSGKITVSSQKDVGSVFRFTVSIQVSELDIFSRQCVCIVGEKSVFDLNLANNLPLKILIAEDNIVNQKVAIKILNKLGYKADIAINGVEVLELLQKQKYDVILMDVQMPEIDGIEATKQIIQSTDLYPRPYIIAMTANAMDSDRKICLDAGMDDYISKPVSVNLLVEALLGSQSGLKMER
jgi:CheY-like chemotaxis protein